MNFFNEPSNNCLICCWFFASGGNAAFASVVAISSFVFALSAAFFDGLSAPLVFFRAAFGLSEIEAVRNACYAGNAATVSFAIDNEAMSN